MKDERPIYTRGVATRGQYHGPWDILARIFKMSVKNSNSKIFGRQDLAKYSATSNPYTNYIQ